MTERNETPLNLDPIKVVSTRLLASGGVEALLEVSARDYERLLAPGSGAKHYSITAQIVDPTPEVLL